MGRIHKQCKPLIIKSLKKMSSFTNDQRNANEDNNIFSLSFKLIKIKKTTTTLNLILLIAANSTKRLALLFTTGRG